MEEKYLYFGAKMGTNFPDSPNSMDFSEFSLSLGDWRGKLYVSHIIKYTIGCQSNGKKAPILWEKYEYQFPRLSTYVGFCMILTGTNFPVFSHSMSFPDFSHAMGSWWEIPRISHMIPQDGNLLEKNTHTVEKVWELISKVFLLRWVLLHFPVLWKMDGETDGFLIWWCIP